MEDLEKELSIAIGEMKKAKTTEDKLTHTEIVRNLSESLGVFYNLISDMRNMSDLELEDAN